MRQIPTIAADIEIASFRRYIYFTDKNIHNIHISLKTQYKCRKYTRADHVVKKVLVSADDRYDINISVFLRI